MNRKLVGTISVLALVGAGAVLLHQAMQKRPAAVPAFKQNPKSLYVYFEAEQLGAQSKYLRQKYTVQSVGRHTGYVKLRVPPGMNLKAFKKELSSLPGAKGVQSPVPIHMYLTPNDDLYPVQWALNNTGANPTDCPAAYTCEIESVHWMEDPPGCDCCYSDELCPYSDPAPHESYNGIDINVEGAWDETLGAGALVAVIDGSFNIEHPEMEGMLWVPPGNEADCAGDYDSVDHDAINCFGRNFSDPATGLAPVGEEGQSHGAFIAGLIGARMNNDPGGTFGMVGVAPESTVMLLQVESMQEAAEAIEFAVDNGAHVISESLGFFKCVDDFKLAREQFAASMGTADNADVAFVSAAGNNGATIRQCSGEGGWICNFNLNSASNVPSPIDMVPDFDNMIAVAALGRDGTRPPFSHFGSNFVQIFAPGAWVLSNGFNGADPSEARWMNSSGTSFAAPHVAGVIALVVAHKGISGKAALDVIRDTTNPTPVVSVFRSDVEWGGMVDAAAAVTSP